jgi:hypothetical protein
MNGGRCLLGRDVCIRGGEWARLSTAAAPPVDNAIAVSASEMGDCQDHAGVLHITHSLYCSNYLLA